METRNVEGDGMRFFDRVTPRLRSRAPRIALLAFTLCIGALASGVERKAPPVDGDTVFIKFFARGLLGGPACRAILLAGRKEPVSAKDCNDERQSLMRLVRGLPLAEKCRFALMSLLSLNLDGDGAEMFGQNYLGADQHAVGVALNRIPDRELMNTWPYQRCKDPARIGLFRVLVKDWIAH